MDGEFKTIHSGIQTHCEEIAFYRGNDWERDRVNDNFRDLLAHKKDLSHKRFLMGVFDNICYKYIYSICLITLQSLSYDIRSMSQKSDTKSLCMISILNNVLCF